MKKLWLIGGLLAIASPARGMEFPACSSIQARTQVQEVVDRSTLFRPFYVTGLRGAITDETSGIIQFCRATAVLSDGSSVPLMFTYRIDPRGPSYLIHVRVMPR